MIADARTFIKLFSIVLTISHVFVDAFEHIVKVSKDGRGLFALNGHEQAHPLGNYDFITRIEVKENGGIWANNPFPFDCGCVITQDDSELRLTNENSGMGSLEKNTSMQHIANLNDQDGSHTTIKIAYSLTVAQYNWIRDRYITAESQFVKKGASIKNFIKMNSF